MSDHDKLREAIMKLRRFARGINQGAGIAMCGHDADLVADAAESTEALKNALVLVRSRIDALEDALQKAAAQFEFYEAEHQKKFDALFAAGAQGHTAVFDKMLTNRDMARMCRKALERTP